MTVSRSTSSGAIHDGRCFLRQQAGAAGLSPHDVRTLIERGELRHVLHGVLVDARYADDVATRLSALMLVRPPHAVVGRRTAAWLRGVDVRAIGTSEPVPVECIVPPGRTPMRRRGLHCFSAPLSGDVDDVGGVPCTTPLRTAVDLLRYLPPHLGLSCADALAHAGLYPVEALCERVETWKGGRFVERARRLAALCEPLTESFGESWTRLRLLDAGFPRPQAQVPLGMGGVEYRLDLGYPDRQVAVEYDGLEFHTKPSDRRHDEARRARIRDVYGWRVAVVGRGDILGRSLVFERGIGELLGLEPKLRRRSW